MLLDGELPSSHSTWIYVNGIKIIHYGLNVESWFFGFKVGIFRPLLKVSLIGCFCQLCIRLELKNPTIKKIYHLMPMCVFFILQLLHGVIIPLVKHCSHVIFKLKVRHIDFEIFFMLFNTSVGVGIT